MVSNKAMRQAIYEKLNTASVTTLLADGSAGIFHAVVPAKNPAAAYPLLVFSRQSDISTLRFGGNAFDSDIWLVKGVARDVRPGPAEDIDKAARDLLDFGSLNITGGSLMHMSRLSGVEYPETVGDVIYRHCGSLYRVVVQV